MKHILASDQEGAGDSAKETKRSDLAQLPSTVLTVEYVDGSDGIDAALLALHERLGKLGALAGELQDSTAELVSVINQQTKEIGQFIESVNGRLDRLYKELSETAGAAESGGPGSAQAALKTFDVPEQFAADPAHQKAWRTACVLTADLEAYYGDRVKESVLYDNFEELLKEPIAKARQTYEERVPATVISEFDYFELALEELVARKRLELAQEKVDS